VALLLSPSGRQKALAIFWVAVLVTGVGVGLRACAVARQVGRASAYDRVRAVLVRRFSVPPERVRREALLDTDLLPPGRALERIELGAALEDELGLALPEADLAALRTVGDLVTAVERVAGPRPPR
jgi:hypothetical protein